MSGRSWSALFVMLPCLCGLWSFAEADDASEPVERTSAEQRLLEPVEYGAVFIDGRYIPPPYNLVIDERELRINAERLDAERIADALRAASMVGPGPRLGRGERGAFARGEPRFGRNRMGRRQPRADTDIDDSPDELLKRLHASLSANRKLFYWENADANLLPWRWGDELFWILLDEKATPREKLEQLEALGPSGIEPDQWLVVVENFEPTPELIDAYRVAPADGTTMAQHYSYRRSLLYGVTVGGIALSVFAFGTLLAYRPHENLSWSATNLKTDALKLVVRSVGLLTVLGLLDLAATIGSAQTIGFYELNPLGSAILENPGMLIAMKIGATTTSGGILFCLRKYYGAQVAAWWLALFCTVLTLRWVTFNSMMLA